MADFAHLKVTFVGKDTTTVIHPGVAESRQATRSASGGSLKPADNPAPGSAGAASHGSLEPFADAVRFTKQLCADAHTFFSQNGRLCDWRAGTFSDTVGEREPEQGADLFLGSAHGHQSSSGVAHYQRKDADLDQE